MAFIQFLPDRIILRYRKIGEILLNVCGLARAPIHGGDVQGEPGAGLHAIRGDVEREHNDEGGRGVGPGVAKAINSRNKGRKMWMHTEGFSTRPYHDGADAERQREGRGELRQPRVHRPDHEPLHMGVTCRHRRCDG